jgi:hypothetical protein
LELNFGICNLSIVPVRMESADRAEIGTQLLFGEPFKILKSSPNDKWVYIELGFDGYQGWIDAKQFKGISKDFYDLVISSELCICSELVGLIRGEGVFFPVVFGTVLPFYKDGVVVLENEVYTFEGSVHKSRKNSNYKFLEKTAFNYLNSPYLWGGKTNFGIDCSGFVQQVFRYSGHQLPRDAYQQAEVGEPVKFEDRKPGDLAFFKDESGRVIHVGMLLENNQIIHASGRVRIDLMDDNGIFVSQKRIHTHKLSSIRRPFI